MRQSAGVHDRVRTPPAADDLLGEALHLLRLTGTLYCRAELTAPWGIAVPPLPELMALVVVTSGHCWLDVDGAEPRLLQPGSLTLLPHGMAHRFRSDPEATTGDLFDIPVEQISTLPVLAIAVSRVVNWRSRWSAPGSSSRRRSW